MVNSVHSKNSLSTKKNWKKVQSEDSLYTLYDKYGHRKYLIHEERSKFLDVARSKDPKTETFCLVLAYTGARISEVLALTPDRIDYYSHLIIFETLKRRRKGSFRAVPVPNDILNYVAAAHNLNSYNKTSTERLWPWCRTTAWQRIKNVMHEAGIEGVQASPKGLRHAFGVLGLQSGVPLNLVSRWLGHAKLETTAIYADAVGDEEKAIAKRFWQTF